MSTHIPAFRRSSLRRQGREPALDRVLWAVPFRHHVRSITLLAGKRMQRLIQSSLQLEIRPTPNHFADIMWAPTMVYTDMHPSYQRTGQKFQHGRVNHTAKVWVDGDVHTQAIEGFWSLVKRGINGVYHSVSAKWLQSYLDEYAWRYNHRDKLNRSEGEAMFRLILARAATTSQ